MAKSAISPSRRAEVDPTEPDRTEARRGETGLGENSDAES